MPQETLAIDFGGGGGGTLQRQECPPLNLAACVQKGAPMGSLPHFCRLASSEVWYNMACWEQTFLLKYVFDESWGNVGLEVGKVKGKVHSMQGPLPIGVNACEAESTFILHHFSD